MTDAFRHGQEPRAEEIRLDDQAHCEMDIPDCPMEELEIPQELLMELLRPGQGMGIEAEPGGGFALVGVSARNVERWEERADLHTTRWGK